MAIYAEIHHERNRPQAEVFRQVEPVDAVKDHLELAGAYAAGLPPTRARRTTVDTLDAARPDSAT